jgi:hypothetical protein
VQHVKPGDEPAQGRRRHPRTDRSRRQASPRVGSLRSRAGQTWRRSMEHRKNSNAADRRYGSPQGAGGSGHSGRPPVDTRTARSLSQSDPGGHILLIPATTPAAGMSDDRVEAPLARDPLQLMRATVPRTGSQTLPQDPSRSCHTRISPGSAFAATRAPMCTAIPRSLSATTSHSPVCTPIRSRTPISPMDSRTLGHDLAGRPVGERHVVIPRRGSVAGTEAIHCSYAPGHADGIMALTTGDPSTSACRSRSSSRPPP